MSSPKDPTRSLALASLADLPPARALAVPVGFTLVLLCFGWLPSVAGNPRLAWAFRGAAAALLLASAALLVAARRRERRFRLEVVLRQQHYVQAFAQLSVLAYWGWYWRQVYQSADLLLAQLVFAYACEALLAWSRRDDHTLGFGPVPIILSINLFLWFKPDWFFLQFVLIALGLAAKEWVRWNKDGRRAHIFNPSSLPLAAFSIVLIATGTADLTWGPDIAYTQLYPPYIYLLIFLVSLPAQLLFGVTLMIMSAVVTSYVLIALHAATSSGVVFETYIPIATFLGMHLLFNDPSTSPRTELGRIVFGMLYGASVVLLYGLLDRAGLQTFYDKLLAVPFLNLSIQGIDRLARSPALRRLDPTRALAGLAPRRRHLVYMGVWAVVFAFIQLQTRGDQDVARQSRLGLAALADGRIEAAVSHFRQAAERGDPAAQSNLGVMYATGGGVAQDAAEAVRWYRVAAERGYAPAQLNLGGMVERGEGVAPDEAEAARWYREAAEQDNEEAQFRLAAMYAEGRGVPQDEGAAVRWYRRAAERGHAGAQSDLGVLYATGRGVPRDQAEAVRWYRQAAEQGHQHALFNLGVMYATGQGVDRDYAEAARWYRLAAEQGNADAEYNLGVMYATGLGVERDEATALAWYRRAAQQGHPDAMRATARAAAGQPRMD